MAGRSWLSLGNNTVALAVNVGLNIVLIPIDGIRGAAIAWSVAIVVRNVLPARPGPQPARAVAGDPVDRGCRRSGRSPASASWTWSSSPPTSRVVAELAVLGRGHRGLPGGRLVTARPAGPGRVPLGAPAHTGRPPTEPGGEGLSLPRLLDAIRGRVGARAGRRGSTGTPRGGRR